jgi:hypothetical protein
MNTHYFTISGHVPKKDIPSILRTIAARIEDGVTSFAAGTPEDYYTGKVIPSEESDEIHEAKELIRFNEWMETHGTSEGFHDL